MTEKTIRFDIHMHSNLDPSDGDEGKRRVTYSPIELFKKAQAVGLQVISLTHHNKLIYDAQLEKQASKFNLLLVPGFEATINGHHVVILNATTDQIWTFEQLKKEKKTNPSVFVLAPHPFYPGKTALKSDLLNHIDLFDAIEYCHFYLSFFNPYNEIAQKTAFDTDKPLIATSDAHDLEAIGLSYSILTTSKSVTDAKTFTQLLKKSTITMHSQTPSFSYVTQVLGNPLRFVDIFKK